MPSMLFRAAQRLRFGRRLASTTGIGKTTDKEKQKSDKEITKARVRTNITNIP